MGQEFLERIHNALWRHFGERPGSIRKTQHALGVCDNYLRTSRRRRSLSVARLGAVLENMEITPAQFFAEAFPAYSHDVLTRFLSEARSFAAKGFEPLAIAGVAQWLLSVENVTLSVERPEALQSELLVLDGLRDHGAHGAQEAAKRAEALLLAQAQDPQVVVRCLGIWASSLRVLLELEQATVLLGRGIEVARHHGLLFELANLVQRASYVVAIRTGDAARGLLLADLAIVLFTELGEMADVGIALLARGYMQEHLGNEAVAIRCYSTALELYLPPEDIRNRFGALQALAVAYWQAGELEAAMAAAERALERVPPGKDLVASFKWLAARLAASLGDWHRAERLYESVLASFSDQPGEAAFASAELVRVYLKQGRSARACAFARQMTAFVIPLERNQLVSAALRDLIASGLEGEQALTLAVVDGAIEQMERGRPLPERPRPTSAP